MHPSVRIIMESLIAETAQPSFASFARRFEPIMEQLTKKVPAAEGDRTYWYSGGCWLFADAVAKLFRGRVQVLISMEPNEKPGFEHAIAVVGNYGCDGQHGVASKQSVESWSERTIRGKKFKWVPVSKQMFDGDGPIKVTADMPWDDTVLKALSAILAPLRSSHTRPRI